MNRAIMFLLLVIFALNFPSKIPGRRTGAPCSAVELMTPNHHGGKMSENSSPFRLNVELEHKPETVNVPCYQLNKRLKSKHLFERIMYLIMNYSCIA